MNKFELDYIKTIISDPSPGMLYYNILIDLTFITKPKKFYKTEGTIHIFDHMIIIRYPKGSTRFRKYGKMRFNNEEQG